jgi:hypothetical protein
MASLFDQHSFGRKLREAANRRCSYDRSNKEKPL